MIITPLPDFQHASTPVYFSDRELLAERLSRCSMKQCLWLLRPCIIPKHQTVQRTAFAAYLRLAISSPRSYSTRPEDTLSHSTRSTDVSGRLHELGTTNLWPRVISSDRKLTIRGFTEKYSSLNQPELCHRTDEVVLHGRYIP